MILPKPFTDKQIMECKDDSDEQYMLGFNRCLEDIAELNSSDAPKVSDGETYPLVWAMKNGYKTGRQWYERFESELNVGSISGARYAAARASGIDLDDINPDGSLKPLKSAQDGPDKPNRRT